VSTLVPDRTRSVEGTVLRRQEKKPPKASVNPLMDAVKATGAVDLACEHVRNVLNTEPSPFDSELPECLAELKTSMRNLAALVAEWEGSK